MVDGDIRRAFSQYGSVREVRLNPRSRRGLDGYVGESSVIFVISFITSCYPFLQDFLDSAGAKNAVHKIVEVGQCRLYTLPPWDNLNNVRFFIRNFAKVILSDPCPAPDPA